jgi:class 3 adenylate cyclase
VVALNPYRTAKIERGGFRAQVTPEIPRHFLEALVGSEQSTQERKLVSILVVDMMGLSAASNTADQEEEGARRERSRDFVRHQIEPYGGTVEWFGGDTLMSAFGVPAAQADASERAVRAALAVLDAARDLGADLRAAVHTRKADVALRARFGETGVDRDAVTTAARLVDAAPRGGVIVDDETYRATHAAIEYRPLERMSVSDRAEPLSVWRAVGTRGSVGGGRVAFDESLVGREDELSVLEQAVERALRESRPQLITIVGAPGMGKTRLVAELRRRVLDSPEPVKWREVRSWPFAGTALSALGQIVNGEAGVLDTDDAETARAKLDKAVAAVIEGEGDRDQIAQELGRIVDAAAKMSAAPLSEQAFAAARAFLEGVAAQRPLVLVFDDLERADATMLEFIEYLVDRATDVPLLVICVARRELYDVHPDWGAGKSSAATLSLAPLSQEETERVFASSIGRTSLRAETQQALLDYAGGNPRYAEELALLLGEQAGSEVTGPQTVQSLVAARLDALPIGHKLLLQQAAVLGKVFSARAVAAISGRNEDEVNRVLHDLAQRGLIRPTYESTIGGDAEYSFTHAVLRDVAYDQLPRGARMLKHEAAALWIESSAGSRPADYDELLAYHYERALSIAEQGDTGDTDWFRERLIDTLLLTAERTEATDPERALPLYERAIALMSPDDVRRNRALAAALAQLPDDVVSA